MLESDFEAETSKEIQNLENEYKQSVERLIRYAYFNKEKWTNSSNTSRNNSITS